MQKHTGEKGKKEKVMEGDAKEETLPPGFRFHPTDEELITYYLVNKISDANFTGRAVADVDLNKCEPWDLPGFLFFLFFLLIIKIYLVFDPILRRTNHQELAMICIQSKTYNVKFFFISRRMDLCHLYIFSTNLAKFLN